MKRTQPNQPPLLGGVELVVLLALVREPMYGLQLIQAATEVSNGEVKLTLGTVYPTLYRIEAKGLIEAYWGDESESRAGARRRYYRITGLGERAIAETRNMLERAPRRLAGSYA